MLHVIVALASALAIAPLAASAQNAATCDTVEVKWTVPDFAANGHFTLDIGQKKIVDPWSDSRTAIVRGKLDELKVEGNQIFFVTREFHELTVTVDDKCNMIALEGKGEHVSEGPYEIHMGDQ